VCVKNAPVRLDATDPSNVALVAGNDSDGSARRRLAGVTLAGDVLEIGINPEFLLDGIKAVGGDQVTMRFVSPTKPLVMSTAEETPRFRYLLMPVRLAG